MSLFKIYSNKLQNALLQFQFIEELIKIYLSLVYWIISKKLERQIPFKFSRKDLEKDSLGKLLEKFAKFNPNDTLINKINQLIQKRNHIAHRAYLIEVEEQEDEKYMSKEIKDLEKTIVYSKECFNELRQELKRLEEIKKSIG